MTDSDKDSKQDENEQEREESSEEKLPAAPAKDGSALGDTDQHSDA